MIGYGLDYSMSSPASCWSDGTTYKYFCVSSWSKVPPILNVGNHHFAFTANLKNWPSQEQRFHVLALKFIENFEKLERPDKMVIEGYAMGAKGVVFNIGENTGIVKNYFHRGFDRRFVEIAPTKIKAFATGKGNAKKEQMADAFKERNGFYVHESLMLDDPIKSPASDCVDAYFMAEYARTMT